MAIASKFGYSLHAHFRLNNGDSKLSAVTKHDILLREYGRFDDFSNRVAAFEIIGMQSVGFSGWWR